MFTIQEVTNRTEVSATTLRTWERRYGVPSPQRSFNGYRLYTTQDLAAVAHMKELLAQGLRPREAALLVSRGGSMATRTPAEYRDALAQREPGLDLDHELAMRMTSAGLEEYADRWLMPFLERMGQQWCAEGFSVAIEHEMSAAILRQLSVLWHELSPGTQRPTVLVGLPAGAHHEIGIFMFAVLLRREGFDVRYLGPDLPAKEWVEPVSTMLPCLVVTAIHRDEDVAAADELIRVVRGAGAGLVAVGGRYQDQVTEAVIRLGHDFTPALQRMLMLTAW